MLAFLVKLNRLFENGRTLCDKTNQYKDIMCIITRPLVFMKEDYPY